MSSIWDDLNVMSTKQNWTEREQLFCFKLQRNSYFCLSNYLQLQDVSEETKVAEDVKPDDNEEHTQDLPKDNGEDPEK